MSSWLCLYTLTKRYHTKLGSFIPLVRIRLKSAVYWVKSSLELTLHTPSIHITASIHKSQIARANLWPIVLRHMFCAILRNAQNFQVLTLLSHITNDLLQWARLPIYCACWSTECMYIIICMKQTHVNFQTTCPFRQSFTINLTTVRIWYLITHCHNSLK